jgi:MarR family transcriptional regulator for hemolysin
MPARNTQIFDRFGTLVAHTARQWRRAVDRDLQAYGLTEATWLPLLHLARAIAPMRQKDLAAALALDNSSVVRLLDALEDAGMIERRADAADRRAKGLVPTKRGRATAAKVETVSARIRAELLRDVTASDIATATRVLDHICLRLNEKTDG